MTPDRSNAPIPTMTQTIQRTFRALLASACVMLLFASSATQARGGQYNAVLNIGDAAPRWDGLDGTDGNKHSYKELADAKCVVVAFTCNSCPYARDVEDRVIALAKDYASRGVRVVAINVNLVAEDLLPEMRRRAQERSFPFPYLHDPTQQIAKDYGAIKTPEFFVLDGSGKVAYMGALDDSPDGKAVTKRHVAEAVEAVLAGKAPTLRETVQIGCRVRYARDARGTKAPTP